MLDRDHALGRVVHHRSRATRRPPGRPPSTAPEHALRRRPPPVAAGPAERSRRQPGRARRWRPGSPRPGKRGTPVSTPPHHGCSRRRRTCAKCFTRHGQRHASAPSTEYAPGAGAC
jgi:hypothetical protein